VVTVERGIDPRRYALLAFGGAGGLHAAAIAQELEIKRLLCPRVSGVLAALGLVISPRRRDVQRSVFLCGDELTAGAVAEVVDELAERARSELRDRRAELRTIYELRYRGQAFELPIEGLPHPQPDELRAAFEAAHDERYGYSDAHQQLELVTIRVSATTAQTDVNLSEGSSGDHAAHSRRATLHGSELEFDVLRGSPAAGTRIRGPAIVELAESTLLVPPDWAGEVDPTGTIVIERGP
jgi:N-methylhydantoinase A